MKKKKYQENPKPKEEYEKHKYEENPEPKRKYEKNKYDTCHKRLCRNEMPCQEVFSKMSLDPITDELKDFKKF